MSKFSELLSFHIQNSGKSKVQIAKAIGMTRTNLQKISTGSRRPQDEHTVEKIMNELILSVKDREELWEAFFKEIIGSSVYGEYREAMGLLNTFYHSQDSVYLSYDMKVSKKKMPKEIVRLQSHIEIMQALYVMFQQDLQENKDKICLLFQPDKSSLLKHILSLMKNYQHVTIEHVICFDHHNETNMGYAQKNLKKMNSVIEIMLHSTKYEAYCYYDYSDVHFGVASLFPNMIMIGEYLLCFDEAESKGFLTKNKDLKDMYYEKFLHIRTRAISLCDRFKFSFEDYVIQKDRCIICHHPLPYVKYAHEHTLFYTKEGLFMYMNDLRGEYRRNEYLMRYKTLKGLKDKIVTHGNIYIIKDMNIQLKKEEVFVLDRLHQYMLYQVKEQEEGIRLKEQSILHAMERFLMYLPNSVMCLSQDESIAYIDELLQEFYYDFQTV